MKKRIVLLVVLTTHAALSCHVVREDLISCIVRHYAQRAVRSAVPVGFDVQQAGQVAQQAIEPMAAIAIVHNHQEFEQLVRARARVKPVLLEVFAHKSEHAARSHREFARVAGELGAEVSCVALDLFAEHEQRSENYDAVMACTKELNNGNAKFPLFLLFSAGGKRVSKIQEGFCPAAELMTAARKALGQ